MKIAFIIGHNREKRGAVRIDTGESEYDMMGRIGSLMSELADGIPLVEVKVFRREPGLGYLREIEKVYDEVDRWGADASIEGHFNSFGDSRANGCEALSSGSVKSLTLAKSVNDAIVDGFGLKDRGIKTKSAQERGGSSLHSGRAPAILIEPFFGSNPTDCALFADASVERKLAGVILSGAVIAMGGEMPELRKSITQSTTIQAQVVQWASANGAGAFAAWNATDDMTRYMIFGLMAVATLAGAWIFRERLIKWAAGDR